MTLSDFASIGSLVSGLAVLGSRSYPSVQNRLLEKNQRALMNQGLINRIVLARVCVGTQRARAKSPQMLRSRRPQRRSRRRPPD